MLNMPPKHSQTRNLQCHRIVGLASLFSVFGLKGYGNRFLNVNGIRGHFDEIKFLLFQLGTHILALNKIKIDPLYPKELTCIPSYEQLRLERSNHGGGVDIYIKDSIRFKHRNDIPTNGLETICIVLAWYRPPSDMVETFDKMEKYSPILR